MNFGSDNTAGIAPEIMDAIAAANAGAAAPYGGDAVSGRLDAAFSDLFETAVRVFPVATGTAANALALAMLCPPYGSVYCHPTAHVATDEAGAPEFYTGGGKLLAVAGAAAKIAAADLEAALAAEVERFPHSVKRAAVSVSQATECGAVYAPDELRALSEVAHAHGMCVHMDGARLANAIAHLGCATSHRPGSPRTARWPPRRWCSSARWTARRWPGAASGPVTSSRRCASPRSSSKR